ncbi:MAG: MFS transporter [Promethearchaeota archaeon]
MAFIHSLLGISTFPRELQSLSLRFFCLEGVVTGIYLSYSWISLYYLSILNSFSTFSIIVAIGMFFGAILDVPLGILTDRFGQRTAFSGAFLCLMIYYFGLILVNHPIELVLLEILVGIYSALLSGSFISWFLNSWESAAAKYPETGLLFRNIMGNVSFAKSIFIAIITFIGGILLRQDGILPQFIFLIQAIVAALGVILGLKLISTPVALKNVSSTKSLSKRFECSHSKLVLLRTSLRKNYYSVIPFFISFSLLSFTSVSFSTLVFSPLLYQINSSIHPFNRNEFIIRYTDLSIILITLTHSLSNVLFAISSRFSGKVTSFIQSSYKGILIFYILDYPVVWMAYLLVLICNLPTYIQLSLIILIFLFKIILSGLATGLYWQLYLKITSSKCRSSQESLFNTINLLLSLIGFGMIGIILESASFIGTLMFLFLISCLGIVSLIAAKNPEIIPIDKSY